MFLEWHREDFSLSAYVALVVSFFLGSGPVLLLFAVLLLWRNANLAGGFAGRPLLVRFFV